MSHIADLHNSGKCGLHRTLLQARGAYQELIRKEARALEASFERMQVETKGIRCPQCAAVVSAARCRVCRFFPVPLKVELNGDEFLGKSSNQSGLVQFPIQRRPGSASQMRPSSTFCSYLLSKKVDEISSQIAEERERKALMLSRVNTLLSEAEQL
jgi:hypothetical protein